MMSREAARLRYADKLGMKIGDLTFNRIATKRGDGNRFFGVFKCKCGKSITLDLGRTLRGRYRRHCGCKTDRGSHRTHGMHRTPEYSSWQAMKSRCLDPNNKDYPRWGGLGITIYVPWVNSFSKFYRHVGPRPHGTTLDRINTLKNYEPGNVRWATATEQQRNKRNSMIWHVKGRTFASLEEAAVSLSVSAFTIWRWVNGAFDRRRGTFTPARKDCHVTNRY